MKPNLVGEVDGRVALRSDLLTIGDGELTIGYEGTTQYIDEALSGIKGQNIYTDTAGTLIMANYTPLDIQGVNWACITKLDVEP